MNIRAVHSHHYIANAYVQQSYPVALVVPDEIVVMKLAREKNVAGDFSEVCKSDLIKDIILADIVMICKGILNGFEIVCNHLFKNTLYIYIIIYIYKHIFFKFQFLYLSIYKNI